MTTVLRNSRQQKALALVTSGALDHLVNVDPDHYLIPSACAEASFYVTSTHDCTCPDVTYNHVALCKHSIALRIARTLDATREDSTPPSNGRMPIAERED